MTQVDRMPEAPAQTQTQTISYRPESAGLASSAVDVLLVLVLLLGGVLALAWVAKQKGWLKRWSVSAASLSPSAGGLRLEQALRLSPRTALFRVTDGDRRYLLVESTGTVRFVGVDTTASDGMDHD